ncbi:MAG TPA: hypothetical protein VKK31_31030, partial [Thermoanaerobaculia bacterium]|nr:hypothetical protein [Thermoanaerobaculia bacterium]
EYYSGLLSGQGGRAVKEAFVNGTEPNRQVSPQWSTINSLPWYQQKAFYIPKEGENMPGKTDAAAPGTPPPATDPGPQEAPAPVPPPTEAAPEETPPPAAPVGQR